jgi:hypothetical protein
LVLPAGRVCIADTDRHLAAALPHTPSRSLKFRNDNLAQRLEHRSGIQLEVIHKGPFVTPGFALDPVTRIRIRQRDLCRFDTVRG